MHRREEDSVGRDERRRSGRLTERDFDPGPDELVDVVQVELAETLVARQFAAQRVRAVAELSPTAQDGEHLGDDVVGRARCLRDGSLGGQSMQRALTVCEPRAQPFQLLPLRRPPVDHMDDADFAQGLERDVALRRQAQQREPLHLDDHPPAIPERSSAPLPFASFARATAAVCASPRPMRMTRMFSSARGIMTFSKRLTR